MKNNTQSLYERLSEMFSASANHNEDPILASLFAYTTEFIKSRKFLSLKLSFDEQSFFEEFKEYIERDRGLHINSIIEAELNSENMMKQAYILEDHDLFYLTGIMRNRKLIFTRHESN